MATLNSQQQATYSKIMATPTPTPVTPATYKVAEVASPVSAGGETKKSSNPGGGTSAGIRKVLPFLFLIGGLLFLAGYSYFWLRFFKII